MYKIKLGSFKSGNTGGMMDNIVAPKLYRGVSVAGSFFKSGNSFTELNDMIANTVDYVFEDVAVVVDIAQRLVIQHLRQYNVCRVLTCDSTFSLAHAIPARE